MLKFPPLPAASSRIAPFLPALLVLLVASTRAHACEGALHLQVERSGVYGLDYAAAVAAQPGLQGCAIDELALSSHGRPVALRVLDNGDGRFDAGDRLEWIGQRLHGPESWFDPFSTVNVYRLDAGPGAHPRITDVRAHKHGPPARLHRHLHLEQDKLMIRLKDSQVKPGEEPDVWYWAKLTHIDPKPHVIEFDLPDLDASAPAPKLTIALRGLSSVLPHKGLRKPVDHHLNLRLNGQSLPAQEWDGQDHEVRTIDLPAHLLRAHGNRLSMTLPRRLPPWSHDNPLVDVVMLDYLDLKYPLAEKPDTDMAFSTGSAGTLQLAWPQPTSLYGSDGHRYVPRSLGGDRFAYARIARGIRLYPLPQGQAPLKPGGLRAVSTLDWHHPAHGYDYLIIAHPSLLDAVRPLAKFHRAQGLKVALINVDDVYDAFNHGIVNPRAIRALIKTARDQWPGPRPRYVLLVGDASFDIRHQRLNDLAYAKWTDRELLFPGHFGSIPGTRYKKQEGGGAARNLIPTWQYYSYEGQSASDNGFVDFDPDGYHPSLAIGRFPVVSPSEVQAIVTKTIHYATHPMVGPWRRDVMLITDENAIYKRASDKVAAQLDRQGYRLEKVYANPSEKSNLEHQEAIRKGIDQGQLLVHFIGHGGRYIWRTGPPDLRKNHDLFTLKDVASLSNRDRLPMVLSMTCYSAPFDNPVEDSIGESFLRAPHGGAVAVFAASWRNSPSTAYSKAILHELTRPGVSIGQAILRAKRQTKNHDMVEMYNLLGDPALVLKIPQRRLKMALQGDRWSRRVVVRIPDTSRFDGSIEVTWLDGKGERLGQQHTYAINATHTTLPQAPGDAREVHVYAFDSAHNIDGMGRLKLPEPAPKTPVHIVPHPLPPARDRVFGTNFDRARSNPARPNPARSNPPPSSPASGAGARQ